MDSGQQRSAEEVRGVPHAGQYDRILRVLRLVVLVHPVERRADVAAPGPRRSGVRAVP